jgi:hypothetical protein
LRGAVTAKNAGTQGRAGMRGRDHRPRSETRFRSAERVRVPHQFFRPRTKLACSIRQSTPVAVARALACLCPRMANLLHARRCLHASSRASWCSSGGRSGRRVGRHRRGLPRRDRASLADQAPDNLFARSELLNLLRQLVVHDVQRATLADVHEVGPPCGPIFVFMSELDTANISSAATKRD